MARRGRIVSIATQIHWDGRTGATRPTVPLPSSTRRSRLIKIAILEFRHRTVTP